MGGECRRDDGSKAGAASRSGGHKVDPSRLEGLGGKSGATEIPESCRSRKGKVEQSYAVEIALVRE